MGRTLRLAYLSHSSIREDEELAGQLCAHLGSLAAPPTGLRLRGARDIPLGTDRARALAEELAAAELVLVLLSADYFAEPALSAERALILARLESGGAHGIIPIRGRPALLLPEHPLAQLQGVHRDQGPPASAVTVYWSSVKWTGRVEGRGQKVVAAPWADEGVDHPPRGAREAPLKGAWTTRGSSTERVQLRCRLCTARLWLGLGASVLSMLSA
jgi:hypothetical protein